MLLRTVLLACCCAALLAAQAPPSPKVLEIPAEAQAHPGFDAQRATDAYLRTVSPEKKARSDSYFQGQYWLILWDFLYGAAIAILLLYSRISARLRDLAARVSRRSPIQTWVYWILYLMVVFVLGLPLTIYESFLRERQYDLMNQSFGAWFGDQLKALAVACVLGGLAVMALFGVVRKLPRSWHVSGAGVAIVFLIILFLIGPVFIAPLFNKYTVLSDARIRDPILRLARANGIPAKDVYQVDASRQSKRVSANVSGFAGTERITLNDNLLNRCSPEAVMAVMGHEMGHYVLNHVYKMILFFGVVVVIFFWILRHALEWALEKCGSSWEIRGVGDVAVIPLAALILSIMGFVFTPVSNTFIRTQEYEADIFGLNAARQPDGFAEAALLLGEYRKLAPGPVEEFVFFDHPSGRTRIYSGMRWKAENLAAPSTPVR